MRKILTRTLILIFALSLLTYAKAPAQASAASVKKVLGVKVTEVSQGTVRLSWNKQKNVTGYQIFQKTDDGSFKRIRTVKNIKSVTISGIDADSRVVFKVRAYRKKNGKKYGTFSKMVAYSYEYEPDDNADNHDEDVLSEEDSKSEEDADADWDVAEKPSAPEGLSDGDSFRWSENDDNSKDAIARKLAGEILSQITTPDMSELIKVFKVYEYINHNVKYSYSGNSELSMPDTSNPDVYTAYGALVNGKAVCSGFAKAFGMFMDKLGVENEYVVSRKINHAWNIVKMGGKWYELDCTWQQSYPVEAYGDSVYFLKPAYYIHPNAVDAASEHYKECRSSYDYREELLDYYDKQGKVLYIKDWNDIVSHIDTCKTPGRHGVTIVTERGTKLPYYSLTSQYTCDLYNDPSKFSNAVYGPIQELVANRQDYFANVELTHRELFGKYFVGSFHILSYAYEANDGDTERAYPVLVNYCTTPEKIIKRLEQGRNTETEVVITAKKCKDPFGTITKWFEQNGYGNPGSVYMTVQNEMTSEDPIVVVPRFREGAIFGKYEQAVGFVTFTIPVRCYYDTGVIKKASTDSVSAQTYHLGETFTSKNGWSITFTAAKKHPLCNETYNKYNDVTGLHNVLIEYTYRNLGFNIFGYEGAEMEASPYNIVVYDGNGDIHSEYSCFDASQSVRLANGESYSGIRVVSLKSESSVIRVNIEGHLLAADEDISFVLDVSEG